MTPTIGRILHVGYGEQLPGITNADKLPCRAAIVSGDVTDDLAPMLPVEVFTPNQHSHPAYVDLYTGWHDPRSCPRGTNDGQRSDPNPITGAHI